MGKIFTKHSVFIRSFRLVIVYAVISLIWIYTSDLFLEQLNLSVKVLTEISIFKGALFVLVTSLVIYYVIKRTQVIDNNYKLLFRNNPQPMWIYDLNSLAFLEVNDAAVSHYGFSRTEFSKMTLKDIRPPEDIELLLADLAKAAPDINPEGIWRHRKKNGEIIFADITSHKVTFNNRAARLVLAMDVTAKKMAEERLLKSEQQYKKLFENNLLGVYISTIDGKLIDCNFAFVKMYGYSSKEEVLQIPAVNFHQDDTGRHKFLEELKSNGYLVNYESLTDRKDGTKIWTLENVILLENNLIQGTIIDITERRTAILEVERLNRVYALLSNTNQAIVRIDDRQELFENICRIAVEDGKFKMAWIGFLNTSSNKVEIVAHAGEVNNYVRNLELDLNDEIRGNGPVGRVFKSSSYYIVNDIENDESMVPWKEAAKSAGYKSSSSLPIKVDGVVKGVLTLYADQTNFFHSQEILLLEEMAMDISFALEFNKSEAERKRAEAEMRVSEKRFSTVFSLSPVAISIQDEKNLFVNVNEAFLKLTGYSREEIIGKRGKDLGLWADQNEAMKVDQEFHSQGVLRNIEFRFRKKSGETGVGIMSAEEIILEGRPANITTVMDITVRKKTEERIKILTRSVEQSPAAIIITDRNANIEFVNSKFTEMTGYTAEEVIGKNPRILSSGQTPQDNYLELWDSLIEKKEWHGEFLNKKKNGELFWQEANISPILNENGDIAYFVAVQEDITPRKRMIEELVIAKKRAEELNKLKSNFLANMSHELRTPMVGILGGTEYLKEEESLTEIRRIAEIINNSGNRLMRTLNQILDLSSIESNERQININRVNVVDVAMESIILYKAAAAKANLTLEMDIKHEMAEAEIDENLLMQIIDNLINNAIKFTKKGGIVVEVCREQVEGRPYVAVRVIDTGIGISKENQEIIFEEFRQASEGMQRKFQGTGLGLTIAKKFTEIMGGEISVSSELNKGTTFTVRLPAVSSD